MHLHAHFVIPQHSPCRPFCPPSDPHISTPHASHPLLRTSINHDNPILGNLNNPVASVDTSTPAHVPSWGVPTDTSATFVVETIPRVGVQEPLGRDRLYTPINVDRFHELLSGHPNYNLVEYVIHGLTEGFSLGFAGVLTHSAPRNLLSAYAHYDQVSKAIEAEVSRGHTVGPFTFPPLSNLHCSPIGAVEKDDGTIPRFV